MRNSLTIENLTNSILQEIASLENVKTASEQKISPEYKTEIARALIKVAEELRSLGSSEDISYDDINEFRRRAGL